MRTSVIASIVTHAEANPRQVALLTGQGVETTYGGLLEMAEHWATLVPSESRVAMSPRSDVRSIAAVIGTWLAGSSVVLMHRHLTDAQAASVIAQSRTEVVVTDAMEIEVAPGHPITAPPGELLVGLTSGTSGTPKLFARDHASWIATFSRSDELVDIIPNDVVAVPGAIDHTHFLYGLIHSLHRGATVDLRGVDSADWQQATVLYSVPTIASDLAARGENVSSLRTVLSSGAAWQPSARESFKRRLPQDAKVYDFYGAGELSFVATSDGQGPDESLGRPFSGVEVLIRRPDGQLAEAGESGLIEVSSDMVFNGYLTATGLVETPPTRWITAGDHGHIDPDGWLFLTGRQSRMFTRGALNVEPEAVERVLSQHPNVHAAACVAQRCDRWGAVPIVFVTVEQLVASTELDRWCSEHLDVVHQPHRILILDQLPTTHRGKIDYRSLEQLADSATGGAA